MLVGAGIINLRLIGLGAIVAAIVGAYGLGRHHEAQSIAVDMARLREKQIEAAELASRKEAERLAIQSERDSLAQQLEDAARSDPDAGRMSLSADSVRRINQR